MRLGTYLGQVQGSWPPLTPAVSSLQSAKAAGTLLLAAAKPTTFIPYEGHRHERDQLSLDL